MFESVAKRVVSHLDIFYKPFPKPSEPDVDELLRYLKIFHVASAAFLCLLVHKVDLKDQIVKNLGLACAHDMYRLFDCMEKHGSDADPRADKENNEAFKRWAMEGTLLLGPIYNFAKQQTEK